MHIAVLISPFEISQLSQLSLQLAPKNFSAHETDSDTKELLVLLQNLTARTPKNQTVALEGQRYADKQRVSPVDNGAQEVDAEKNNRE